MLWENGRLCCHWEGLVFGRCPSIWVEFWKMFLQIRVQQFLSPSPACGPRETFLFHLVLYVTVVSTVCLRFGSWFLSAKEENVHKGDYLQKTTDLFTVTGMAVLIHEDPKRLASDTGLHCNISWHPKVYIVNNIKTTNVSTPFFCILPASASIGYWIYDILFINIRSLGEKNTTWQHPQDVARIRHMEAQGELFHLKKTLLTRLGRGVLDGCAPCWMVAPCLPLQALQELLHGLN